MCDGELQPPSVEPPASARFNCIPRSSLHPAIMSAIARNVLRRAPLAWAAERSLSSAAAQQHYRNCEGMYQSAPISDVLNDHALMNIADDTGVATLRFECETRHCHSAGTMHGAAYFKLLDDSAFFTAQALVHDVFVFTTSFTSYIVRPVAVGTKLVATGRVVNASKSLIVAEATVVTAEGKLVAHGSGTFGKSPFVLADMEHYRAVGGAAAGDGDLRSDPAAVLTP